MGFNAISAQLDLIRIMEEAAAKGHRIDTGTKTETNHGLEMSHVDPISSKHEEGTEITAMLGQKPAQELTSGHNPYFDIEKLKKEMQSPVHVKGLLKSFRDPQGRRTSPRYKVRLRVVLYTALNSFRTTTKDLSLNGALLQDALPEQFVGQEFDILFIVTEKRTRKKEYFIMRGKAVDASRIRIAFENSTSLGKMALETLMENLSRSVDQVTAV